MYKEAWVSGCKGLTVYRDGSRDGVLNAKSKKEEQVNEKLIKRPEYLDAKVIRFQNHKEKWVAVIGTVDETPYEIFTGKVDADEGLNLPASVTDGQIQKVKLENGEKRYDFHYTNKKGIEVIITGLSYKFNSEYWNYAKLVSAILREGIPIDGAVSIINGLDLDDSIVAWKTGVVRALKGFIKDGTKSKKKCSNCNEGELIYSEGCLICPACGDSKCGG